MKACVLLVVLLCPSLVYALDAYTGLVATRGLQMTETRSTNRQSNSRSPHVARTALTSIQVVFPGWYINGSFNETAPGAAITITASVEYPAGTFTQLLFSGVTSGTVPNGGYLVSDALTVSIADGETFWVRSFLESTSLLIAVSGLTIATGQQYEEAVSGLTDKSMGGTIAANSRVYAPVAIIGTTTQPSFAFMGDSITFGIGDGSAGFDMGPYARALGGTYAYTKIARTGDTIAKFVAGHTNRAAIAAYASHWVYGYGSNDLFVSSRTAAQVMSDLATAVGYASGKPVYTSTITPRTQSPDGWQTVVNQSQSNATAEAERITLNGSLRSSSAFTKVFEEADTLESGRDSGWWLPAPSSQYYTTDGIHPTSNGYALMQTAVLLAAAVLADVARPVTAQEPTVGAGVLSSKAGRVGTAQTSIGAGVISSVAGPVQ